MSIEVEGRLIFKDGRVWWQCHDCGLELFRPGMSVELVAEAFRHVGERCSQNEVWRCGRTSTSETASTTSKMGMFAGSAWWLASGTRDTECDVRPRGEHGRSAGTCSWTRRRGGGSSRSRCVGFRVIGSWRIACRMPAFRRWAGGWTRSRRSQLSSSVSNLAGKIVTNMERDQRSGR